MAPKRSNSVRFHEITGLDLSETNKNNSILKSKSTNKNFAFGGILNILYKTLVPNFGNRFVNFEHETQMSHDRGLQLTSNPQSNIHKQNKTPTTQKSKLYRI